MFSHHVCFSTSLSSSTPAKSAYANEGSMYFSHLALSFLPNVWHENVFLQQVCLRHSLCKSYAGQVVVAGRWTPACFRAASRQHGDLGAEVVAAASRWMLVFGVRAHVSLQVPPPPLPLDLPLDLQWIRTTLLMQPAVHHVLSFYCMLWQTS